MPKQKSLKPENRAFSSNAPFEGATTARNDYKEHPVQPRYDL